jgi:hypothetical protein
MGTIRNLNKPKETLTVEKLRTFEGLENLTNEEAIHIIDTLTRLSILTFKFYREYKELKANQNQKLAG